MSKTYKILRIVTSKKQEFTFNLLAVEDAISLQGFVKSLKPWKGLRFSGLATITLTNLIDMYGVAWAQFGGGHGWT